MASFCFFLLPPRFPSRKMSGINISIQNGTVVPRRALFPVSLRCFSPVAKRGGRSTALRPAQPRAGRLPKPSAKLSAAEPARHQPSTKLLYKFKTHRVKKKNQTTKNQRTVGLVNRWGTCLLFAMRECGVKSHF